MTNVEKMYNYLNTILLATCPVLSGNMKKHIKLNAKQSDMNEMIKMSISAPFYDMKIWKKTGQIVYLRDIKTSKKTGKQYKTYKTINGKQHYAEWVNEYGAFGKGNKSKGWVNRACFSAAMQLASELEANGQEVEIIFDLEHMR